MVTRAAKVLVAGPIVKTDTLPRAVQVGTASTHPAVMGGMPGKRAALAGWRVEDMVQVQAGKVDLGRPSCSRPPAPTNARGALPN